jgi:multicomponent Na+:H+ antiporter subunit B
MRRTIRLLIFLACSVALAAPAIIALRQLSPFGHYRGPYGDIVNAIGVDARHVTNMVSLVNYDVRGLDTLGEESILFAAVAGVVMLLRGPRGETASARPERIPHRRREGRSEAVTLFARHAVPLIAVVGIYVVLHAGITPGGGFQGGVIVFAALLLIFLGDGYAGWRKIVKSDVLDLAEAAGVGLYLAGGLIPVALGALYLQNVVPLGQTGSITAGGLIPIVNFGVGLAVASGLLSIALELLEETRVPREPQP